MRAIRNPRISPNVYCLHIAFTILMFCHKKRQICIFVVFYEIVTRINVTTCFITLSGVHMIHPSPVHAPVRLLAESKQIVFKLRGKCELTCTQTCCPSLSGRAVSAPERQVQPEVPQGGPPDPSPPGSTRSSTSTKCGSASRPPVPGSSCCSTGGG